MNQPLSMSKFASKADFDKALLERIVQCKSIPEIEGVLAEYRGSAPSEMERTEAPCRHEWYQGACAHCLMDAAEFRALKNAAPQRAERLAIPVREIIWALEREAANTDDSPQWRAATILRRMTQWQARTLICNVSDGDQVLETVAAPKNAAPALPAVESGGQSADLRPNSTVLGAAPIAATPNSNDGWIVWKGGECPVPDASVVEYRCGSRRLVEKLRACELEWNHVGDETDITSYRVVADSPSERSSG